MPKSPKRFISSGTSDEGGASNYGDSALNCAPIAIPIAGEPVQDSISLPSIPVFRTRAEMPAWLHALVQHANDFEQGQARPHDNKARAPGA